MMSLCIMGEVTRDFHCLLECSQVALFTVNSSSGSSSSSSSSSSGAAHPSIPAHACKRASRVK